MRLTYCALTALVLFVAGPVEPATAGDVQTKYAGPTSPTDRIRTNEESLATNEPAQVSEPGEIMTKKDQNEERGSPTLTKPFLRLWEKIKGVLCLRTGPVDLKSGELVALDAIKKWNVDMKTRVQHERLQGHGNVDTPLHYGELVDRMLDLPGVEPEKLMKAIHEHRYMHVDNRRPVMMQSYLAYKYQKIVKDRMLAVWLEDGIIPELVSSMLLAHYNELYMSNETFDVAHEYATKYHEVMVEYIQMYRAKFGYEKEDEEDLLRKTEIIKQLDGSTVRKWVGEQVKEDGGGRT